MCILAGCDFVKALSGIGVRKAHQHVKRLRDFTRVSCMCHSGHSEPVNLRAGGAFSSGNGRPRMSEGDVNHALLLCKGKRGVAFCRTCASKGL